MCHRFVKIKMRWFVGLLMWLSFHSRFFTVADTSDETVTYTQNTPDMVTFPTPVPIQVGDKTVQVGALGAISSASSVLVIENSEDSSKITINATYPILVLYSYCDGQDTTSGSFDCAVRIMNVNYLTNFEEKNGQFQVAGARGNITNSNFVPTASTVTNKPTTEELVTAFTPELMPLADPPSELIKKMEKTLDDSFAEFFDD